MWMPLAEGGVMEMQHLNERDLKVGEPIPWNVYDRNGQLLLHAGVVIESTHQVAELKERGLFVNTSDWEVGGGIVAAKEKISAFMLLDELHENMERLFGHISVDDSLVEKTLKIVKIIQQACEVDEEVAIASIFIGRDGRYPVVHPIQVGVLCEIVAKHFGRPAEERQMLVAAAITMNVSMVNLQTKLHVQKELLSEAQRQELRNHPQASFDLLKQKGVTDPTWLNAVLQHHEKADGSGYAQGLSGGAISPAARLITLADVYCALVTARIHRPAMLPNVAMREVFLQRGKQVDPVMTDQFVKVVGIYPPGTFLRLMNGEIAIVTRHGKSSALPIVQSVAGARGAPLSVYIKRDCSNEKYAIREVISKDEACIKVNRYALWGHQ
jgi:HD-GYP domain-containing protein (c-di-GMP phosphodiesterase class II)